MRAAAERSNIVPSAEHKIKYSRWCLRSSRVTPQSTEHQDFSSQHEQTALPTALGELGDLAPVSFRWTAGDVEVRRTFELDLSYGDFAFTHTLFGLVIEELSFLRGN